MPCPAASSDPRGSAHTALTPRYSALTMRL